jgi:hypothetical protein
MTQNAQLFKPRKQVQVDTLPEPKGRLIAIGDIHGCINEYKELVSKLQVTQEDLVVLLGDLIDRGPDSEGVIQYTLRKIDYGYNFRMVLGNHDSKSVRYHHHVLAKQADPTYKIPMRIPGGYLELSYDSLEFLASAPHAIFIPKPENYVFPVALVHAGLSPSGFRQDPQAFIRNRYFTKNHATNSLTPVKSIQIDGIWHVPENSYPWTYFWDGRWTVVYGHSVYSAPEVVNNTIGIDGGCCFGGDPCAWVLDKGSSFFVEVPA